MVCTGKARRHLSSAEAAPEFLRRSLVQVFSHAVSFGTSPAESTVSDSRCLHHGVLVAVRALIRTTHLHRIRSDDAGSGLDHDHRPANRIPKSHLSRFRIHSRLQPIVRILIS